MTFLTKIISQPSVQTNATNSHSSTQCIQLTQKLSDQLIAFRQHPWDQHKVCTLMHPVNALIDTLKDPQFSPSKQDTQWISTLLSLFPSNSPLSTRSLDLKIKQYTTKRDYFKSYTLTDEDQKLGITHQSIQSQAAHFDQLIRKTQMQKQWRLKDIRIPTKTDIASLVGNLQLLRTIIHCGRLQHPHPAQCSVQHLTDWRDTIETLGRALQSDELSQKDVHHTLNLIGETAKLFKSPFTRRSDSLIRAIANLDRYLTRLINEKIAQPAESKIRKLFECAIKTGKIIDVGLSVGYVPTTLSKETVAMLDVLLSGFGLDDTHFSHLTTTDKWLTLVGLTHNVAVQPHLLLLMIPDGPSGKPLDTLIEKFKTWGNPRFHASITTLLNHIRKKAKNASGAKKERWETAEIRFGQLAHSLWSAYKQSPTSQTLDKLSALFERFYNQHKTICSVGIDLRLLSLFGDISRTIGSRHFQKDVSPLDIHCVEWAVQSIILILNRVVSVQFATSVHNVNATALVLLKQLQYDGDLSRLKDAYLAPDQGKIETNAKKITTLFRQPGPFVVAVSDFLKPTHHSRRPIQVYATLNSLRQSKMITYTTEARLLTDSQRYALTVACVKKMKFTRLTQLLSTTTSSKPGEKDPIAHYHQKLVNGKYVHGLPGIAAEINGAYFHGLKHLIKPEAIDKPDPRGFTLLFCAVYGGNAKVIKEVWQLNLTHQKSLKAQVTAKLEIPNILGLAAESGSEDGFHTTIDLLRTIFTDKEVITLLTLPDSKGYTPLMRAILSPNKTLAIQILTLLKNHNKCKTINWTNTQGQNALVLAISEGATAVVAKLLEFGADPNHVMPRTFYSMLHLAVIQNKCEIASLLMRHPKLLLINDSSWRTAFCHARSADMFDTLTNATLLPTFKNRIWAVGKLVLANACTETIKRKMIQAAVRSTLPYKSIAKTIIIILITTPPDLETYKFILANHKNGAGILLKIFHDIKARYLPRYCLDSKESSQLATILLNNLDVTDSKHTIKVLDRLIKSPDINRRAITQIYNTIGKKLSASKTLAETQLNAVLEPVLTRLYPKLDLDTLLPLVKTKTFKADKTTYNYWFSILKESLSSPSVVKQITPKQMTALLQFLVNQMTADSQSINRNHVVTHFCNQKALFSKLFSPMVVVRLNAKQVAMLTNAALTFFKAAKKEWGTLFRDWATTLFPQLIKLPYTNSRQVMELCSAFRHHKQTTSTPLSDVFKTAFLSCKLSPAQLKILLNEFVSFNLTPSKLVKYLTGIADELITKKAPQGYVEDFLTQLILECGAPLKRHWAKILKKTHAKYGDGCLVNIYKQVILKSPQVAAYLLDKLIFPHKQNELNDGHITSQKCRTELVRHTLNQLKWELLRVKKYKDRIDALFRILGTFGRVQSNNGPCFIDDESAQQLLEWHTETDQKSATLRQLQLRYRAGALYFLLPKADKRHVLAICNALLAPKAIHFWPNISELNLKDKLTPSQARDIFKKSVRNLQQLGPNGPNIKPNDILVHLQLISEVIPGISASKHDLQLAYKTLKGTKRFIFQNYAPNIGRPFYGLVGSAIIKLLSQPQLSFGLASDLYSEVHHLTFFLQATPKYSSLVSKLQIAGQQAILVALKDKNVDVVDALKLFCTLSQHAKPEFLRTYVKTAILHQKCHLKMILALRKDYFSVVPVTLLKLADTHDCFTVFDWRTLSLQLPDNMFALAMVIKHNGFNSKQIKKLIEKNVHAKKEAATLFKTAVEFNRLSGKQILRLLSRKFVWTSLSPSEYGPILNWMIKHHNIHKNDLSGHFFLATVKWQLSPNDRQRIQTILRLKK